MKFAKIKFNDIANAPGVSISVFTQGCPHHCIGCFNQETWDFNGGQEFTPDLLDEIANRINENGIHRNLCILGGEPLCPENQFLTRLIINTVRQKSPSTPVYIWTGYTLEELMNEPSVHLKDILSSTNYLIDGPFIQGLKDLNLMMRGSSNQRIINVRDVIDFQKKI